MCGIAGIYSLVGETIPNLDRRLDLMSKILEHRGPDGNGKCLGEENKFGFVHRRLAIIDLNENASQPMQAANGNWITYNGEIYNYIELREQLKQHWSFRSNSDTEVALAAFDKFGTACLDEFRGMFGFSIWDEPNKRLFCARDRFGIKPFYYLVIDNVFYFASETKALLPFVKSIDLEETAFSQYLTFQYTLGENTLFSGIKQLLPGHAMLVENGCLKIWRYWDISYKIDYNHSERYFEEKLQDLLHDSMELHCRSDVPIGSYVSGGIDSSLIYKLSQAQKASSPLAFHGLFSEFSEYDESAYAKAAVDEVGGQLLSADITSKSFSDRISEVIYHLDFPTAGPGAFAQFMVSELAASHVKVVLGGQGGDEIFGGYARYLAAYLEQCLKAAIEGTYKNGNYVVTIESIIPNLTLLKEYKPLLKRFWSNGLFEPMDKRYLKLIDRSADMGSVVNWNDLDSESIFSQFSEIFNNPNNVGNDAYFDKMTHFDFKCLIPALLQVEDRMSMAHGIESRVPFLDHPLVEFAASIPADIKFKGGRMKNLLKTAFKNDIPNKILDRKDKMGFPVPLKEWFQNDQKEFLMDTLTSMSRKNRPYINSKEVLKVSAGEAYSRKTWGLISMELWYQQFHDRAREWQVKL